jgi:hypothetical protein
MAGLASAPWHDSLCNWQLRNCVVAVHRLGEGKFEHRPHMGT